MLTRKNAKTIKGEKQGFLTSVLHLAPADLSGKNVCGFSSIGCKRACINKTGKGNFPIVQNARIRKTNLYFSDRKLFLSGLYNSIGKTIFEWHTGKLYGLTPVFRLNATSDLPFETIKYQGKSMFDHFPEVQFYDYSKNPKRMFKYLNGDMPGNYHLTFSKSETNSRLCKKVLDQGGNVAIVFDILPTSYWGYPVVIGDNSDLRFLDGENVIVGLSAKGKAKNDTSGFTVRLKERVV